MGRRRPIGGESDWWATHPRTARIRIVDFRYQAKSWNKPRRVVCKIEWHQGELFPRSNFVVTNSRRPKAKVGKASNGRGRR
ncbi:MAG: transposase [Deltaproteobacteria bacterium]|nr:transposase [Deltaproteobacteria bacterium]